MLKDLNLINNRTRTNPWLRWVVAFESQSLFCHSPWCDVKHVMAFLLIFETLKTHKVGRGGGRNEEGSKEGKVGRGKGMRKEEGESP